MDVSSMNLQVMVPRATETSQVQHNLNQQVNIQQDFEAIRQKADDALKQKQVRAKSEAEDGKMSEAILYAMDAPRAKSADAAADFVEKWQDSKKPPTARIAAFFEHLLQASPTDGTGSAIW